MAKKPNGRRVSPTEILDIAQSFAHANLDPEDIVIFQRLRSAILAGDSAETKVQIGELDPFEFLGVDRHRFLARRQTLGLITKLPWKMTDGGARRKAALKSFIASERSCKKTNRRFSRLATDMWRLRGVRPLVATVLEAARDEMVRLLGRCDIHEIVEKARPGPGVTLGIRDRRRCAGVWKLFGVDHTVTNSYWALRGSWMLVKGTAWDTPGHTVTIANASRLSFVPKDWKTDRAIAVEPSMNTWLQLGVHEVLSGRLARTGNSIRDQSRNGLKARDAYHESACTLDLSRASDSVSIELVRYLLTPKGGGESDARIWLDLLCGLRTTQTVLPGSSNPLLLEKFSSMGNGFTFVLETIIFLALARASARTCGDDYNPTCYGDDIIVGLRSALLLTEVLEFCGFQVNSDKSFYLGSFRESCGMDWYEGEYCTPMYLREEVREPDLYELVNGLRHSSLKTERTIGVILRTVQRVYGRVIKVTGDSPPNSGVLVSFAEMQASGLLKWDVYRQNWRFKRLVFLPTTEPVREDWIYVDRLRAPSGEQSGLDVALKGVGRLALRYAYVGGQPSTPLARKCGRVPPT